MFSLLYGLWEYVFRKEELRVLILGLDKAGKTTLLEKLKVGMFFSSSLKVDDMMCYALGCCALHMLLLLMPLPPVAFHHPYGTQRRQRNTESPAVKPVARINHDTQEEREVALCTSSAQPLTAMLIVCRSSARENQD